MNRSGHSGKRKPSKRVTNARNEMRTAHFLHEFDEDEDDWQKEKKFNSHRDHSSIFYSRSHNGSKTKLKRRNHYKIHQDDFYN